MKIGININIDFWDSLRFLLRCYRYKLRTERQQLEFVTFQNYQVTTVLDIGAHRGLYSYWLSKLVGHAGTVHAFEPQPEMINEIERAKRWFNLNNLHIHSIALSSKRGKARLKRGFVGNGGASIEMRDSIGEEIEIDTISLDEKVESDNIRSISFIKCDVEGHELSVFEGAVVTLEKQKPTLLFEARVNDPQTASLFKLLEGLGYVGTMLLDGKFYDYHAYNSVKSKKFGYGGHRDFVFTHISRPVKLANGTLLGG